ncbi:MAG: 50S ribosomal protein L9 [Nannocystaceae bacterium]
MINVILKQDVDNLGRAGEIVEVRPGYGRNYLIPRGLALLATRGNVAQHEHYKRAIEAERAKLHAEQRKTADVLKATSVSIARKVGKDNKLFGSVGPRDIVEALAMQNIDLDRRLIRLDDAIRETGTFEVPVRFSMDLEVPLKVNVVGI